MGERAIRMECRGAPLVGILHSPEQPARRGVLIVVGGPQYRIGSHRQFVLLARHLAEQGIAALRFDYRGIGDSGGEPRNFLAIDADIEAALEVFERECPELEELYLWGLCDAASAALFYAHRDRRIAGLVLCNPWVRTESGHAQAIVKSYYRKQLSSADFWRRLLTGGIEIRKALAGLAATLRASLASTSRDAERAPAAASQPHGDDRFPERMLAGLNAFDGRVLLILSGNDLTAAEFDNLVGGDRRWKSALSEKKVRLHRLPDATHTFSKRVWKDQVAEWTVQWIRGDGARSDAVIT